MACACERADSLRLSAGERGHSRVTLVTWAEAHETNRRSSTSKYRIAPCFLLRLLRKPRKSLRTYSYSEAPPWRCTFARS
eukprot:1177737-Prorocentrum_minimum.AAC.1